jgi:hypothetical protein
MELQMEEEAVNGGDEFSEY